MDDVAAALARIAESGITVDFHNFSYSEEYNLVEVSQK